MNLLSLTKVWSVPAVCGVCESENMRCAVPVWCLWRLPQRSCEDWAAELNCCSLEPAQTYPQTCRGGGVGEVWEKEGEKMWKRMREWTEQNMHFEITKGNIILEASSEFHSRGFVVYGLLNSVFCSQQIGAWKIEQNRSRCRILPSHDEELVDLFLDEGAAGIPHLLLQFLKLSTIILSWQTNSHRTHSLQNAYCFEMRLLLHLLPEANFHLMWTQFSSYNFIFHSFSFSVP